MAIQFDGQVVLVTGSSRGLGRAFAESLAGAGATVIINSTGSDQRGDELAASIIEAGGRAEHVIGTVEQADELIDKIVASHGRLDAVVHNAGFLRDKTLRKMSDEQWHAVLDVHLGASFRLARAAWPHFQAQSGGRLVLVSSAAGLYGNFGQSNYAAAKMGMYGLAQSIALEGARENIHCNVVAPFGATEMNSATWDEERKALLKTKYVAPLITWLAHPDCSESGSMFEASAGSFKKLRWQRSAGLALNQDDISVDHVAGGWQQITDFSEAEYPANMLEALTGLYQHRVE